MDAPSGSSAIGAELTRYTDEMIGVTTVMPGLDGVCYIDIDETARATYGHDKDEVGLGHAKLVGLDVLLGTVFTPVAAPLQISTRLRGWTANRRRRGPTVTEEVDTARRRCHRPVLVRTDSGFSPRRDQCLQADR